MRFIKHFNNIQRFLTTIKSIYYFFNKPLLKTDCLPKMEQNGINPIISQEAQTQSSWSRLAFYKKPEAQIWE